MMGTAGGTDARTPRPLAVNEEQFLRRLILYGFLLRAVVSLALHWSGFSAMLAPDELTYARGGLRLEVYLTGDTLVEPEILARGQAIGYFYINALFYWIFGQTVVPLKLFNCFLGAFSCRYFYLLASALYGKQVGRRAATLIQFFPSLVLWSALNIRDVWVILLLAYISLKSLELIRERSLLNLGKLVAAIYAVAFFREYLYFVVAIPPIVALVIGRRGQVGRSFVFACVAAVTLVGLFQGGFVGESAESHLSLETIDRLRQNMAAGGSAFEEQASIATPGEALAFLPTGLLYFLFAPFPWQITSLLKLFSLPEMIFLYGLTPAIARGVFVAVRRHLRESFQVLLLTGLLSVSYALGEGNIGTLYRHRAQVLGFYLIFAAVGIEARRSPKPGGLTEPTPNA